MLQIRPSLISITAEDAEKIEENIDKVEIENQGTKQSELYANLIIWAMLEE